VACRIGAGIDDAPTDGYELMRYAGVVSPKFIAS